MRETMTSRQRVLAAIEHRQPDRVPIDLGMHFSTGISAFGYWNLREYLGLPVDVVGVPDMGQFLARVEDDVLDRFHCDCVLLYPRYAQTAVWNPRGHYRFEVPEPLPELQTDGSYIIRQGENKKRMPSGGFFFDGDGIDYGDPQWFERTCREAERLYKETDRFTALMDFHAFFSDNPDFLCDMLLEPEKIKARNAKILKESIERAGRIIDRMGKYIQAVTVNSDLGMQNAPFCDPKLHAQLCAPYLKELCGFIHRNSDFKIFMHSCGAIEPFLEILIDCGVDAINPVQVAAAGMDPKHLKEKYGSRIAFWGGGCDTQRVLPSGTAEDVRRNVRELMEIFKPGGGFIFNQVHNIMGDIAPEKIVAMLDTAYEKSWYN